MPNPTGYAEVSPHGPSPIMTKVPSGLSSELLSELPSEFPGEFPSEFPSENQEPKSTPATEGVVVASGSVNYLQIFILAIAGSIALVVLR